MKYLLHHLLSDSAKNYPDKPAVVFGNETTTYQELDDITTKLALSLIDAGIKRRDRVGIYLNKSISSVIAINAVLKAGGIYVPLDPNAPLSRLGYIILNSEIRCVLTSAKKVPNIAKMFPENNPLETIVLMDNSPVQIDDIPVNTIPWSAVNARDTARLKENIGIETDLAYILYTSGSTGDPKGVMISHLNALTFINWSHDELGIQTTDHISSHAPLHFDLSIFDIFTSIRAGATIFPVPEEFSIFPRRLIHFLQQNKITVWYSVPSVLTHMIVHGNMKSHSFPDMRLILFAGEVFPVKYLRELMEIIPKAEYFNLYGPTETNVCTFYQVKTMEPDTLKPVPIGRACKNMEVFSLDEHGNIITESGKEGELCVRGSCVAQGYWRDRQKTEIYFIRNFLLSDFDEKMYKTGDIVTRDDDGNYHLIGRRDHMIKSRGYRIEIGEIEAALLGHTAVKEVAVVAIPDEHISNRIKAFVVPMPLSKTVTKIEIEQYLSKKIPHYMIPEIIEFCTMLPKTSSGKIDRKLLSTHACLA